MNAVTIVLGILAFFFILIRPLNVPLFGKTFKAIAVIMLLLFAAYIVSIVIRVPITAPYVLEHMTGSLIVIGIFCAAAILLRRWREKSKYSG